MSCDFGQFDIAGFPKPHAYWYQANWLQGFGADEVARPPLPFATVAHILSLPGVTNSTTTTVVSAITTAPFAELVVDGTSLGVQAAPRDELGQATTMQWTLPTAFADSARCARAATAAAAAAAVAAAAAAARCLTCAGLGA